RYLLERDQAPVVLIAPVVVVKGAHDIYRVKRFAVSPRRDKLKIRIHRLEQRVPVRAHKYVALMLLPELLGIRYPGQRIAQRRAIKDNQDGVTLQGHRLVEDQSFIAGVGILVNLDAPGYVVFRKRRSVLPILDEIGVNVLAVLFIPELNAVHAVVIARDVDSDSVIQ